MAYLGFCAPEHRGSAGGVAAPMMPRITLSPARRTTFDLPENCASRLQSGSMLRADCGYDADWIRELAIKKG